jgi:cytoskeletal protein CcmA (bactofilin family)
VRGEVVSTGDLAIDGQVQGTIELGEHNLTIGPCASVVANLAAKSITVSGTVVGNIVGTARVELKAGATVEGDVTAPTFVMDETATLTGKVDTGDRK